MSIHFERKDCPTIMAGLVVRYQLQDGDSDAEINASREGVSLQGEVWPIMALQESIAEIIRTLRKARIHHEHLRQQYLTRHACEVEVLSEEEVERRLAGQEG